VCFDDFRPNHDPSPILNHCPRFNPGATLEPRFFSPRTRATARAENRSLITDMTAARLAQIADGTGARMIWRPRL